MKGLTQALCELAEIFDSLGVDVHDVLFTQGQLDREYLVQWAQALGISDRLMGCLKDFDLPPSLGL